MAKCLYCGMNHHLFSCVVILRSDCFTENDSADTSDFYSWIWMKYVTNFMSNSYVMIIGSIIMRCSVSVVHTHHMWLSLHIHVV